MVCRDSSGRPGVGLDAGMDEVIADIGTDLLVRHVHPSEASHSKDSLVGW